MKKLFLIFTLLTLMLSTSFDSEARKKFGSRSKGKTQETTQAKQQDTTTQQKAAPKKSSSKKGLMAGIFGGLLMGGMIAAMMGGDFEGLQIMDMLLMALVAFVLFKLFKSFMQKKAQTQSAYAGQQNAHFPDQQQKDNVTPFATSSAKQADSVPFNLPQGFDVTGFLKGANDHYHTLQKAWNENNLETIQEYVSIELFNELTAERKDVENVDTQVLFVDCELARANTSPVLWEVSVKFSGKYRDLTEQADEQVIDEVWHLERNLTQTDSPWLIVGIEDKA